MAAWLNWLGLARKAGKLAPGSHQVEMALKDETVALIVVAEDAGASVYRKYHLWAQDLKVPILRAGTKVELGSAIGMGPHAILAILDVALAKRVWMATGKQIGGMEFGGKGKGQNPSVRTSQGVEARQQAAHRSVTSAQSRKHQESHEHRGTGGRADRPGHHAGQATTRAEGTAASRQLEPRGGSSRKQSGSSDQPTSRSRGTPTRSGRGAARGRSGRPESTDSKRSPH
jgi:ribosomal protein L7Ae-like RNA K-turn-binding protein